MGHLLYLMFRCDGDVIESLDFGRVFEGTKHTLCNVPTDCSLCMCMLPLLAVCAWSCDRMMVHVGLVQ